MRIAIFIGKAGDIFIKDFVGLLSANNEIKISRSIIPSEINDLCQWADIAFAEWAGLHAILLSKLPKLCPIILRLHSCEVFDPSIAEINWNAIDRLIFVSHFIQDLFNLSYPNVISPAKQVIIANGIDTNKFTLRNNFTRTNKIASISFTFDGNKNAFFALQCFYELLKRNEYLTLHFTAKPGETIEHMRLYLSLKNSINELGLADKVFFEGNIPHNEMNSWLEDKDYILSTSQFESFGANIAEGMSKGIKPIIYAFPGSEKIFPKEYLFSHISQCSEILSLPWDPTKLRNFIIRHYSLLKQVAKILICINEVLEDYGKKSPDAGFVQLYWENRYKSGANSGSGSYGRLAQFKAKIINDFIKKHDIANVLELGCGDGNQLSLSSYKNYYGFDISESAVRMCKEKFASDAGKYFELYEDDKYLENTSTIRADIDLAISLDVIFHLVEDDVFEKYMENLFSSSNKYIIIYSSNFDAKYTGTHERHRRFTRWVASHHPEWEVIEHIRNKYPFDPDCKSETSNSDFYIFEKRVA